MAQESRWINCYLFDFLKSIIGNVAAMINLLLFGFLITKGVVKDMISRMIFALSLVMLPVFYSQNMWPNITFGALVFLPVAYYISKKAPPFLVFAIASISFVLLFCIVPALKFKANILHLILCIALIFPFFRDSSNQLKLFAKITSYYKEQLALLTENMVPEENYQIAIFVHNSEIGRINKQISQHFGVNLKWGEPLVQ